MADHTHSGGEHTDEVRHEPLPIRIYAGVLGALGVLTAFTVWIAQFHFGEWNMMVAMAVAVTKASLVVLFFMNLRYDHDHLNRVIFVSALLFLGIYLAGTFSDIFTRGDVDPWRGQAAEMKGGGPPALGGGAAVAPASGEEHH
jgi:cytochrome c oxidase subunit 4